MSGACKVNDEHLKAHLKLIRAWKSYSGQSLVHLWSSFLHGSLLNEAAGQLAVILSNAVSRLLHHFPLLGCGSLYNRGSELHTTPEKNQCVCVCVNLYSCKFTLRAAAKVFFRLAVMLLISGSLQVIMAIPAVKLRIMWWAATRMCDSSESRAKSFLTICSHVVMAILIERSTTG